MGPSKETAEEGGKTGLFSKRMEPGVGTWQKLWVPTFSQCPGPAFSDWGLEAIFGSFQNIPEGSHPLHSAWDTRGVIEDGRTQNCPQFFLSFHQPQENNSNTSPEWGIKEGEGSSTGRWWACQRARRRWIKHLKSQDPKMSQLGGILEVSWFFSLNMDMWGRLERVQLISLKKGGRKIISYIYSLHLCLSLLSLTWIAAIAWLFCFQTLGNVASILAYDRFQRNLSYFEVGVGVESQLWLCHSWLKLSLALQYLLDKIQNWH